MVITRRRPPTLPYSLAAAKPARVRSTISSRSISARALMTWKKNRPAGVLVSMLSVRLRKFTPRACSSDTSVIRSRTLLPSLSSFQTTSTSLGRSRRSARFNPGRRAFFPAGHILENQLTFCADQCVFGYINTTYIAFSGAPPTAFLASCSVNADATLSVGGTTPLLQRVATDTYEII